MSSSIYHFFARLAEGRAAFSEPGKLAKFPFPEELLSLHRKGDRATEQTEEKESGKFPDLAIRITPHNELFTGGELVELKDSNSYGIASFNSTIPTGMKSVAEVVGNESSGIFREMKRHGDDVWSLPVRQVFYLVRGRDKRRGRVKVCLVHGSFFETVKKEQLIREAFRQVLEEQLGLHRESLSPERRERLESAKNDFVDLFDRQEAFSKTRPVERASVRLRFRIMTGATPEGNILNGKLYPAVRDDTLNLVVPTHAGDEAAHADRLHVAFDESNLNHLLAGVDSDQIVHPYNGAFSVYRVAL